MRLFWWGVELYARYDRWKLRTRGALYRLCRSGGIHADETLWRVMEQRLREADRAQQHPWNEIIGEPMPNFSEIPSTEALLELHKGHDFKLKIGQRLYSPIGCTHEIVGYEHKFSEKGQVMWGYSLKKEETGVVTFWSEGTVARKFKLLVVRPGRRRALDL